MRERFGLQQRVYRADGGEGEEEATQEEWGGEAEARGDGGEDGGAGDDTEAKAERAERRALLHVVPERADDERGRRREGEGERHALHEAEREREDNEVGRRLAASHEL